MCGTCFAPVLLERAVHRELFVCNDFAASARKREDGRGVFCTTACVPETVTTVPVDKAETCPGCPLQTSCAGGCIDRLYLQILAMEEDDERSSCSEEES